MPQHRILWDSVSSVFVRMDQYHDLPSFLLDLENYFSLSAP